MVVVKTLSDTNQISNPAIRDLVQQRLNDLGGEDFGSGSLGYVLVVEAGDALTTINDQLSFDVMCNRWTGIRFNTTGFTPLFEFVQDFPACYDMVFILSDEGFGVEIFIPKGEGVDHDLISMCRMYAFKEDGS